MNKAMVIGNLGADPVVRYTKSGTPVATFSVATTERWKDKEGNPQEHTEWHRIVAWNGLGKICGEYLTKGSKVYVEGKMRNRKWTDNEGLDRYTNEIVIYQLEMLCGSRQGESYTDPNPEPDPNSDVPF